MTSKTDYTVSPLLQNVDIILGMDWLQRTQPLIDWSMPRLVLPGTPEASTVIGTWLDNAIPIGQVAVLRDVCRPSLPFPPSPRSAGLAVLSRPAFWSNASSGHAWAHVSSPGGVAFLATSTSKPDNQVQ